MQNRIIPMAELKALLDKYFTDNPDLPEITEDYNDALQGGCKFALLQFDDEGAVSWEFLADVRVCADPACNKAHGPATEMSKATFDALHGGGEAR